MKPPLEMPPAYGSLYGIRLETVNKAGEEDLLIKVCMATGQEVYLHDEKPPGMDSAAWLCLQKTQDLMIAEHIDFQEAYERIYAEMKEEEEEEEKDRKEKDYRDWEERRNGPPISPYIFLDQVSRSSRRDAMKRDTKKLREIQKLLHDAYLAYKQPGVRHEKRASAALKVLGFNTGERTPDIDKMLLAREYFALTWKKLPRLLTKEAAIKHLATKYNTSYEAIAKHISSFQTIMKRRCEAARSPMHLWFNLLPTRHDKKPTRRSK